ncbi:MAG TPA: hypothetical protein ENG00_00075 [Candidatus Aenigmarchaeota archaeon]|nr:hypothetical protein [Candidatus Aenigmarchaeota archaeon]
MARKGAFQLSLGFIVAVVFAVILLSLALTWLQGIFDPLSTVTHKTTDIAMQKLLQELASTNKKVGIAAPGVTEWKRGETGAYALGIKNEDTDKANTYYINVYLETVGGDIDSSQLSSLQDEVKSWITLSPPSIDIPPNGRDKVDIIIKPTPDALSGIYSFRAAVCTSASDATNCHATSPSAGFTSASPSLYGSASFAIEIVQ